MSLKSLSERVRSFADASQPPASASASSSTTTRAAPWLDVDALADELEALDAIYAGDEPDEPLVGEGGRGGDDEAGGGALHILQVDEVGLAEGAAMTEDSGSVDLAQRWRPGCRLRLTLNTCFQVDADGISDDGSGVSVPFRLAITLPPTYPFSTAHDNASDVSSSQAAPPQLQLLSRFIGPYAVDPALFGAVLRTYLHYHPDGEPSTSSAREEAVALASSPSDERPLAARYDAAFREGAGQGVRWAPGEPVLYEGIEAVRELVSKWFAARRKEQAHRAKERGRDDRAQSAMLGASHDSRSPSHEEARSNGEAQGARTAPLQATPSNPSTSKIIQRLVRTEPLVERKSIFIAHAARLDHPDEVPIVLAHILSDRKIARATHPIINAWVCTLTTATASSGSETVVRDHDDDGETAAGGRLAHLLDLLTVSNAIVVVTRWYGGVLLGPERFKLINRVARNALELAGLVVASSA